MTIKTTSLGGTDWSDGDVLYADDLLDTLKIQMLASRNAFNSIPNGATGPYLVDFSMSSGTATLTRGVPHIFESFTMSGGTLTTDSDSANDGKPLIIIVGGNVSLTGGTIDLDGKGFAGGTITNTTADTYTGDGVDLSSFATSKTTGGGNGGRANDIGGGGGGGAGANAAGSNGTDATGGGGNGGTAGTFVAWPAGEQPDDLAHAFNAFCGAGGGIGGGGNNGTPDAPGGNGGGALILVASGDLNFGASATITADGANGTAAGDTDGGGGGGGGGGTVVLLCDGTLTNSGTITHTAGSGGASDTDGGAGGNGGAGQTYANTF